MHGVTWRSPEAECLRSQIPDSSDRLGTVATPDARTTRSESETMALGRELSKILDPGSVVLLSGDLGAGKTVFVKGIAEGLGINPRTVDRDWAAARAWLRRRLQL